MTLDDPPPHSTLHTYKHTRGPELRRLFVQNGTELGIGNSSTPRLHQVIGGSRSQANKSKPSPKPPVNPTKVSEKNLYPSLSTNRTQQTSIATASDADEFYDFDEAYVHDLHVHGQGFISRSKS